MTFLTDFWTSPTGEIFMTIGEFMLWAGVTAGGIAGLIKMYRWTTLTGRWGLGRYRERRRVEVALDELTSADGWPNGSRSLKESHQALYDKVTTFVTDVAGPDGRLASIELKLDDVAHQVEAVLQERRSS